jgi:serine/threonine protein kinase
MPFSDVIMQRKANSTEYFLVCQGMRRQALNWPMRLKICLGVARGLHYLHALAHPRVIHRDIKASNVLLDKNLEPKIADFGLALLFPDEQSHIMTVHVAGTKYACTKLFSLSHNFSCLFETSDLIG